MKYGKMLTLLNEYSGFYNRENADHYKELVKKVGLDIDIVKNGDYYQIKHPTISNRIFIVPNINKGLDVNVGLETYFVGKDKKFKKKVGNKFIPVEAPEDFKNPKLNKYLDEMLKEDVLLESYKGNLLSGLFGAGIGLAIGSGILSGNQDKQIETGSEKNGNSNQRYQIET